MRIVIFGSTGGTGRELVNQALERGWEVIAFARQPAQLAIKHPRLYPVQGDVLDPKAVADAVEGADVALSALGVRLGQPPGTVRSQGTRHIVNALDAAGISRFVSVSTLGVGDSRQRQSTMARWLLPRIIGAERLAEAERQEQIIADSLLAWTILRPARLVDGPSSQRYRLGTDLRTGLSSQTRRADLATALLDQLTDETFLHQCPAIIN